MGFICGSSRFEQRNMQIDDYNTLDATFVGGDGRPLEDDFCPVDKLFLNYGKDISNLPKKESKEVYELYRINRNQEIEDDAEELARSRLKLIISLLESMRNNFEKEGRKTKDYKKVMVGQKYTTEHVMRQLNIVISQLTLYVEESPTAAQVLDLDALSGMKSETIRGDSLAWKRLHLYML